MTKAADRVSTWKHPDAPVFNPEPAKVNIGDEYATIEVTPSNWPDDLDHNDIVGWPVVASEKTDDGCEVIYEGEIREVATAAQMTGLVRKIRCKPACDPGQQLLPGAFSP